MFEDNNPPDIPFKQVLASIRKIFPNVKVKDIRFIYHGSYNVYLYKDEHIFKFPDKFFRNEKGSSLIRNEVDTLLFLHKKLPFKTPFPLNYSSDPPNLFIHYKKIQGVSLSRIFHKTSENKRKIIAQEIGNFLSYLHDPTLKNLLINRFNVQKITSMKDYISYWRDYYYQSRAIVSSILNPEELQWIDTIFDDFLSNKDNFKFSFCLTHRDFDCSNILVDPKQLTLTGIIDFEETSIFDPAIDLLFFEQGEEFLQNILDNYSTKLQDGHLLSRMKFLSARTFLCYLEFGINNSRPAMIQEGLRMLKVKMKLFPVD
ncbi:MAG: phosphotransferase family protein [Candidatus Hodarchaeales archaeon]